MNISSSSSHTTSKTTSYPFDFTKIICILGATTLPIAKANHETTTYLYPISQYGAKAFIMPGTLLTILGAIAILVAKSHNMEHLAKIFSWFTIITSLITVLSALLS